MNFTGTQGGDLSEKRHIDKCTQKEDVLERPVCPSLEVPRHRGEESWFEGE